MSNIDIQMMVGEFAYELGKALVSSVANIKEAIKNNVEPTGANVMEAQKEVASSYINKCRDTNVDLVQFIEECREVGIENELIDHMTQQI